MLDAAYAGGFSDDDWAHARGGLHLWTEVDGVLVSHAAVVPRRIDCAGWMFDAGYVEAVATAADHRGRGFGTAVMTRANDVIRGGFAIGVLSTSASDFYARIGWERWLGPTFVDTPNGRRATPDDDGGIMILRTPRSSPVNRDGPIVCEWRAGDVW